VDDITAALERLRENDIQLIDEQPVIGTGGKKIAFIHPKGTHGVLVELYQLHHAEQEIRRKRAQSLAERVLARGQVAAAATLGFLRTLRSNGSNASSSKREEPPKSTA
jgi:hypothetical protein